MILKMKSLLKRERSNFIYFKVIGTKVFMRTPRGKYIISKFPNLDVARKRMMMNGYKEVKQYKKLTEIQWLDKVCENFKDDGLDNGF